jgi:hypothetical protein
MQHLRFCASQCAGRHKAVNGAHVGVLRWVAHCAAKEWKLVPSCNMFMVGGRQEYSRGRHQDVASRM